MYVCPLINEATFNHRSPFSIYKLTRGLPKNIKRTKKTNKKILNLQQKRVKQCTTIKITNKLQTATEKTDNYPETDRLVDAEPDRQTDRDL